MNRCARISLMIGSAALSLLAAMSLYAVWDRLYREVPEPAWVNRDAETRFMYASLGTEKEHGIPYWVYYVLPRLFPEKLPGPGGYASLGFPWQEGYELPVGFTKKTVGYPRVSGNCALCHSAKYRQKAGGKAVFVPFGPGRTGNVEGLFRFLAACARDPRFNSNNVMFHILQVNKLDPIDAFLYRYVIIPDARKRLLALDSALDLFGGPHHDKGGVIVRQAKSLPAYGQISFPPRFPKEFPIDRSKAQAGRAVFDRQCAGCHVDGRAGSPTPVEVGFSRDRLANWRQKTAMQPGPERRGRSEDAARYRVPNLDGIWLRAPYLRDGSVPSLRDLLTPPAQRPKAFRAGCDVFDPVKVGFKACGEGETAARAPAADPKDGDSPAHSFGTDLPDPEKANLIEYLKTL